MSRLREASRDDGWIWAQLGAAYLPRLQAVVEGDHFDADGFARDLAALPLPDAGEVAAAMLAEAASPTSFEQLDSGTLRRLGAPDGSVAFREWIERVQDDMVSDGRLALLADDMVFDPVPLLDGAAFTKRLSPQVSSVLLLTADLAPLHLLEPRATAQGGRVRQVPDADGTPTWFGPSGWLDDAAVAPAAVVRVADGVVSVAPAASYLSPESDPAAVRAFRAAYDDEVADEGLPLDLGDVVLATLLNDPGFFSSPRPPLSELVAAAGLEERRGQVADQPEQWARRRWIRRAFTIAHLADDEEERSAATAAIAVLWHLSDGEQVERDRLNAALDSLHDPGLFAVVSEALLEAPDESESDESLAELGAMVDRLTPMARRSRHTAVVAMLRALVAERRCHPVGAEAALRDATIADPEFAPAIDRLAWTLSDAGRAADARALWQRLELGPDGNIDLAVVSDVVAAGAAQARHFRRNEPCWCGSGRKYKACHLRSTELPALPDRFHWMLRKPVAHLERHGGQAYLDLVEAAAVLAEGDLDRAHDLRTDTLVVDTTLFEGGWLQHFLRAREAILPADEVLLYQSWLLSTRSVFEVTALTPGTVTVRDLRTGDVVELVEHTMNCEVQVGALLCSRILSDGGRLRFGYSVFGVIPGTEEDLLDALDSDDPQEVAEEVLGYLAAAEKPPTMVTRENEPLVQRRVSVRLPDVPAAWAVLDVRYERHHEVEDSWEELFELADGDTVVRAQLTIDDDILFIETSSDDRMERVLTLLRRELPDLTVLRDDRKEIDDSVLRNLGRRSPSPALPEMPAGAATAMQEWIREREERWCEEPVPALHGMTPREAADDRTRRPEVIRLIDSFPSIDLTSGAVGMEPERLRELLGLGGP